MKRLIIGISGVSGVVYGMRSLQVLRDATDIETYLVVSQAVRQILSLGTDFSLREMQALADVTHNVRDIAAGISSDSSQILETMILFCSIKTLSGIIHSYTDGLLTRAAGIMPEECRPLMLYVREAPLYLGYLRLTVQVVEISAVIMSPVPVFYHHPRSLDDTINRAVDRVFNQFAVTLPGGFFAHWQGVQFRYYPVSG